jgi:peptidoglycan-associated lipoprotein
LRDVFFEFDDVTIREDQRQALHAAAAWLRANPAATLTIQGHSDERGTSEYNLALGERRAAATKAYLVALGIVPDRIRVVSYGEERPFVLGHDEEIWRWNRRAHLLPSQSE